MVDERTARVVVSGMSGRLGIYLASSDGLRPELAIETNGGK